VPLNRCTVHKLLIIYLSITMNRTSKKPAFCFVFRPASLDITTKVNSLLEDSSKHWQWLMLVAGDSRCVQILYGIALCVISVEGSNTLLISAMQGLVYKLIQVHSRSRLRGMNPFHPHIGRQFADSKLGDQGRSRPRLAKLVPALCISIQTVGSIQTRTPQDPGHLPRRSNHRSNRVGN
jgi:hypothetical protein